MPAEALTMRPPTDDEMEKASEAMGVFARALKEGGAPIRINSDGDEKQIDFPHALGQLVLDLLAHVARGEMVTFVPYGAELTTQQAADLLNVSRPFLVKLLEAGDIEHHKVGSHRRVPVEKLLEYKEKRDHARSESLSELQRLGQEFDAG